MLRVLVGAVGIVGLSAAIVLAADDKKANQEQPSKATITKVDAKNGTITVRMKDKDGKEVERVFKLTEDARYFDSTGKAAAIEVFQSGNDVLVVEAEGHLKELRKGAGQRTAADNQSDSRFLQMANETDVAEIQLGDLAQQRAASEAVKKFGERMVKDHTRMNKELRELASKQGVTLSQKLGEHHQELVDRLGKLKGAEFDREYAKDMVAGHEKALAHFEMEAKDGQDAAVRTWAAQSVKALKEHLELARQTAQQVKNNAK